MKTRRSPVGAIGRWSARHPWRAIAAWLAFVAVAVAALAATGSKSLQNDSVGDSRRAESQLTQHQVRPGSETENALLQSDTLRATDPAFRAATAKVSANMSAALGSPVSTRVSSDGHSVLVAGPITRPFDSAALGRAVTAVGAASPQVSAVLDDDSGGGGNNDLQRAERLSLPVTLLVLLLAFGAIVAALVPLALASTAVVAAFGLLGPISQFFPLDDAVKTVVLLIGMAVGVDYALFYVVRSREERRRGLPSHEALERTAYTSGRTVLLAGLTVAVAMAGQFAIGSPIFDGVAAGTIAVVVCAVAGSLTVLPAVLELLGPRIDRGRIPFLPDLAAGDRESRFWTAWIDRVLRRPLLWLAVGSALLAALALPAAWLRLASPADSTSLHAQITKLFPSTSTPAVVVLTAPPGHNAALERAARRVESLAAARGIAHRPFAEETSSDGQALAVSLPLTGPSDSRASRTGVDVLRSDVIPEATASTPGVHAVVGGETARDVDFTKQIRHGLPYVVAFVLGLAFLILLVAFRSIVVPMKAIALNLLSVAASYGVLVLVFQHHWAESLLGFHSNGAIVSWLPLFLFVVLFGLSMDYHLFILSRVREGVDDGMTTDDALRYGIAKTAGVVTSAALVMVGVFSLFGTASALDLKQAGVGLAVAVLLDATVVRAMLLPASMKLLGERNWYLPRWLEWLPRPNLEGTAPAEQRLGAPAPATTPN